MTDQKSFVLYRNTKSRTEFEREEEAIDKMEDDKEAVEYEEFAANCEHGEIAEQLGYSDDLKLEEDWSVGFQKSKYGGLDCFLLEHTECDFIFLKPNDAEMLQKAFAQDMTAEEWQRRSGFGKNATDPR